MRLSSSIALLPLLSSLAVHARPLEPEVARSNFLAGINIAGFDFGMDKDGGKPGTMQKPDIAQIKHFTDQGVNIIRLPFRWEYLEPNGPNTGFDQTFMSESEPFVKATLDAGAYVLLDCHNYARYNGKIIGEQDGPSTDSFAAMWAAWAKKYGNNNKIIYGLMNEPFNMPNNDNIGEGSGWFEAVQKAVDAIRDAGAKTSWILLPGTGYSGGGSFKDKNFPALSKITDKTLGNTDMLAFDIHQYLDQGTEGNEPECDTSKDYVKEVFEVVTTTLGNRKALISEIGGGSTQSCVDKLGAALKYLKTTPSYLGWTVWSAGSFKDGYELNLSPNNGQDVMIWTEAILPAIKG